MTVGEVLSGPKPGRRGPCVCHFQVCIDIVYAGGLGRILPNELRDNDGIGCGSTVGRGYTVAQRTPVISTRGVLDDKEVAMRAQTDGSSLLTPIRHLVPAYLCPRRIYMEDRRRDEKYDHGKFQGRREYHVDSTRGFGRSVHQRNHQKRRIFD